MDMKLSICLMTMRCEQVYRKDILSTVKAIDVKLLIGELLKLFQLYTVTISYNISVNTSYYSYIQLLLYI